MKEGMQNKFVSKIEEIEERGIYHNFFIYSGFIWASLTGGSLPSKSAQWI